MSQDLPVALRQAAVAAERWAPPCDPVHLLRTRRRTRRRVLVTAGAVLGFSLTGQALLPPPASGAERTTTVAAVLALAGQR